MYRMIMFSESILLEVPSSPVPKCKLCHSFTSGNNIKMNVNYSAWLFTPPLLVAVMLIKVKVP